MTVVFSSWRCVRQSARPTLALHPVAAECFITGEARRVDDRVNLLFRVQSLATESVPRRFFVASKRATSAGTAQARASASWPGSRARSRSSAVLRSSRARARASPPRRGQGQASQPHPETATAAVDFGAAEERTDRDVEALPGTRGRVVGDILRLGYPPPTAVQRLALPAAQARTVSVYHYRSTACTGLPQFARKETPPSILDCSRAIQPD